MFFKQLFDPDSSTYTYLIADDATHEAVIIDPVIEQVERDLKLIREHGLKLKYALETHVHADHITAAQALKKIHRCGHCCLQGLQCAGLRPTVAGRRRDAVRARGDHRDRNARSYAMQRFLSVA